MCDDTNLDLGGEKSKHSSFTRISPNSMFLSIVPIVWLWLKPTLPEPLSYRRGPSKKLHGILKLVQIIKKQENLHMRFCYNYELAVLKAEEHINRVNIYIYSNCKYCIYHYINEKKCYKNMLEHEKRKHTILKIKKNFIVSVLGTLLECCFGVQDNLM